ncbi:Guanylate-binding protein C-terminal domain superfamily [Arabidopsis thaliana x Arabidopsis arenosa]|uniref:Guanylate-binding protein C-terminal domain superfamily n=1 Tax=Arabidopsis thaliana x Arabidopsis arenosa TaxID=1240361 RepID=A0A8T2C6E9_9BRAS|nr:Guanylate-binding protein C-terminal domain superfamily [Arabidopsis thaliana x Arabidopsis arenosa]
MRNPTEESGRAIQLVYVDENGKLKTDPEAIGALKKLKGPVAVVSLFGKALHGKSFIWNQLLSRSIGFEVQTLHRPCNGDIWMWIEPVKRISEDGTEYSLVLLDVEWEDSKGIPATRNSQIFSLAILLSSVFIYGPTLGVNDIALDLSRLLEIRKQDQVGEAKDNTFFGLGQFSPMFVRLMRDINSETVEGGEDVTQNSKLEKLRPQILYGIDALMKFVSERVRPKQRGDTIITGPPLAGFTKAFSENVNNNIVPKISSLWQTVEELEGRRARDTATEVYMSSLERSETPDESMLIEAHNKAVVKALTAFCESSIGNVEVKQKHKRDLWSFFAKALEDHKRVANVEAYSRCCNAIEDMGKKLWALPCSHDANIGDMIKALDTAVGEYEISINGPMKWQKLSSFLRKSIQDILAHRRGNQMDELLSENSKLKLQQHSMESTMNLLKKQLEGGEKMNKEYQKRYESAIDDISKLSDQFKNRIHDLESKCKSIHDEHSNLMEVLGSTRLEVSEWKRKYEGTLDENGVGNNRIGVDAPITRCSNKLIDWKIKYENSVSEQKAVSEKIAAMEERLKQASATEDGMRAEYSRILDEKEKVITEKAAKLATLEQQLGSTRSELKKSVLKVDECSSEAKDLRLQISALNEKYESVKSASELLETETQTLKREKDELDKKCHSHLEELEKLVLRMKNVESEALEAKKLVDSLKMVAEAARDNENKLQTSLVEKCIEIDRAKSRIEELEKICTLNSGEGEDSASKKLVNSMKMEAEVSQKNENKLQTLLEDKCIEIDLAKSRIEELERDCLKLKDVESEAAIVKGLVSSMKMEVESARSNEKKLKMSLQEKSIEMDRAKGQIKDLERQKMELSETLETRAKQNEEAVTNWQRIINSEKAKNMRVNLMEKEDSFMVSDEATPMQRVKRLKVEAAVTCSGSDFAQETEEDTVSQESRKVRTMTPRRCTSTEAGTSSSTGTGHSKYTMKKLRSEILEHGFGAELVGLKNPRKRDLVQLYERTVLRK